MESNFFARHAFLTRLRAMVSRVVRQGVYARIRDGLKSTGRQHRCPSRIMIDVF